MLGERRRRALVIGGTMSATPWTSGGSNSPRLRCAKSDDDTSTHAACASPA
jgi:hypothetical protein